MVAMGVLGAGTALAETYGDPLGLVAVGTTSSDNPNGKVLAVANGGTATSQSCMPLPDGWCYWQGTAINTTGQANGGMLAVSVTGCSGGNILMFGGAVSGTNCAQGDHWGISGLGSASGGYAISGAGPATAGGAGISGLGSASGYWLAIGGASANAWGAWPTDGLGLIDIGALAISGGSASSTGTAIAGGNATGRVAVSGKGTATGGQIAISPAGDASGGSVLTVSGSTASVSVLGVTVPEQCADPGFDLPILCSPSIPDALFDTSPLEAVPDASGEEFLGPEMDVVVPSSLIPIPIRVPSEGAMPMSPNCLSWSTQTGGTGTWKKTFSHPYGGTRTYFRVVWKIWRCSDVPRWSIYLNVWTRQGKVNQWDDFYGGIYLNTGKRVDFKWAANGDSQYVGNGKWIGRIYYWDIPNNYGTPQEFLMGARTFWNADGRATATRLGAKWCFPTNSQGQCIRMPI